MDLHNNIKYVTAVEPWNPAATGTKTGQVIDLADHGHPSSVEFVVLNGDVAATGFSLTPVILAGSASGSLASAADADLIGTEAGAVVSGGSSDKKTAKVGYTGTARYLRCDLIVAGAATGYHAAVAVLGGVRKLPQSSQTV